MGLRPVRTVGRSDWHPALLLQGNPNNYVTDKRSAARLLYRSEENLGVTFAALENTPLDEVRAAYSESLSSPDPESLARLRDAVGELFHLEE